MRALTRFWLSNLRSWVLNGDRNAMTSSIRATAADIQSLIFLLVWGEGVLVGMSRFIDTDTLAQLFNRHDVIMGSEAESFKPHRACRLQLSRHALWIIATELCLQCRQVLRRLSFQLSWLCFHPVSLSVRQELAALIHLRPMG